LFRRAGSRHQHPHPHPIAVEIAEDRRLAALDLVAQFPGLAGECPLAEEGEERVFPVAVVEADPAEVDLVAALLAEVGDRVPCPGIGAGIALGGEQEHIRPLPPASTSRPAPARISAPWPPNSLSVPSPPLIVSRPLPPERLSEPLPS
jgi:hypothetical protein